MLTLALDEAAQSRFESERQRCFPAERNQIPAHLTLFHTLPEGEETASTLAQAASARTAFAMRVEHVRSIGRGVAYFLDAPPAIALHRHLSGLFAEQLSAQDRQGFRPHVVVQNKVDTQTARDTLAVLQASFAPWTVRATGLDLWQYLGGPWKHLRRFEFQNA